MDVSKLDQLLYDQLDRQPAFAPKGVSLDLLSTSDSIESPLEISRPEISSLWHDLFETAELEHSFVPTVAAY